MVRTKFMCMAVDDAPEQTKRVTLQAVNTQSMEKSSATVENKGFSKWISQGNINLVWSKQSNHVQFVKGREYFVEFAEAIPAKVATPAPAPNPAQPPFPSPVPSFPPAPLK